eukprot:TRINITY_DN11839_c0_g1_i2.p2 TRINITY_DN11839_c0_g1~~TRINITY_DN11839_c0_g1_i2.p2  ORF type:complete len:123 (-),score=11.42 TRINITY_DN11839_c0_g1_i2:163-531(-)
MNVTRTKKREKAKRTTAVGVNLADHVLQLSIGGARACARCGELPELSGAFAGLTNAPPIELSMSPSSFAVMCPSPFLSNLGVLFVKQHRRPPPHRHHHQSRKQQHTTRRYNKVETKNKQPRT